MEEYVLSAIDRGLTRLVFLEHLEEGINASFRTWLTEEDFDVYFEQGRWLQQRYGGTVVLKGVGSLVASAGRGPDGLVLSGHTDTVPFDENRWNSDPFMLTETNGRLYGLGTADMKSFFALIIEAIRELDLSSLQQPLIILATADEETSMNGARALNAGHLQGARFALIGEPTGLKPVRMHKGMMMEAIRLTGLSGHSSNPALGHSALEAMHRVMTELLKWREEMQHANNNPLFEIPVPTMNPNSENPLKSVNIRE